MNKTDLEKIAKYRNVKLNEALVDKIIRAKDMLKLGRKCPCEPTNDKRYCGSPFCMAEVYKNGRCHCGLFEKCN